MELNSAALLYGLNWHIRTVQGSGGVFWHGDQNSFSSPLGN